MDRFFYRYINAFLLIIVLLMSLFVPSSKIISYTLLIAVLIEMYNILVSYRNKCDTTSLIKNLRCFKETNKSQKLLIKRKSEISDLILEVNNLLDAYSELQVSKKHQEDSRKKLLANLSHDIRTPLTSIIGYIDALKDGVVSTEEEQKEFIDILSMKSKNLKDLTDQIFNIAKIDSDEIQMDYEYIELNEFMRNTIIDFIPQLEKYSIDFVNEIKEENFIILADRISLTRIFQNIIKNTIQHGRDGQLMGIRTRLSNKYYRVVIWDRGKGIPKAKQQYIFERLFKVDDSRKNETSNSGLGMSIAKKLVEKHNGNIFLKSEENNITEFFVELPILKELNI